MRYVPLSALYPTDQILEQLNNGFKEKVGGSDVLKKGLIHFHHKKNMENIFDFPQCIYMNTSTSESWRIQTTDAISFTTV